MAKSGPETALVKRMRDAGFEKYGPRLVTTKYFGDAYSEAGVSDLLCCLNGVFIACEVKSPEASQHKRATVEASIKHALEMGPTLKQRAYVKRILVAGGVAGFAATVEQFMVVLACADAVSRNQGSCTGHNLNGADQ